MTVPLEVPGRAGGGRGMWMWVWLGRVLMGCKLRDYHSGGLAQLVEHLLCKQGVLGSSP